MLGLSVVPYQSGNYPFPRHDVPVGQKLEEWHKKFCEAMFASWISGNTGLPYSKNERFEHLRAIGNGTQSIEQYQDTILGPEDTEHKTGAREGYSNIVWKIFSVAPKFKYVVMGIMESQEHSIVANAIDKLSVNEKDTIKWDTWFESVYKKELSGIRKSIGMKESSGGYLPETKEELELFQNMGGMKLKKEVSIVKGIDYGFYISDWKQLKRKLIEDFIDINIAATKDYIDQYTKKVKARYVNPSTLMIQYSRRDDFKGSEWGGELIQVSITDLRKNTDLTEDELRDIAQKYNNVGGNPDFTSWGDAMDTESGGYSYDGFFVDVADCEFKTVNDKYITTRKDANGNSITREENATDLYKAKRYYGKDTDKRKTKKNTIKTVQRAKWIVGTEHVYDWGLQFDVPRPGKKEVELSFHVYKLPGRSIMDLTETNHDQIALTSFKLQNAIAMSSNAGLAVEYTSLQNMKLGGNKMEPLEILKIRRETGDLVYRATTHRGQVFSSHAGKPVQELEGGIGKQLTEFITIFQMNLEFIRDVTGINQVADASTPDPEQSVFGSKLAIAGTNNALKNIYSGYIYLKEKTAKNMALRLQIAVRHSKEVYAGYYPVLGKSNLEVLSIGTEILDADFYIKIEARPTDKQKEDIRAAAVEAMKPTGKSGESDLDWGDFLLITDILDNGDIKFAQALFIHKQSKNKREQLQLQRENMSLDTKNAQETLRVKGEEERKKEKFKTDELIRLDAAKTDNLLKIAEEEHRYKMQEIGKKERDGSIRDGLKEMNTQGKTEKPILAK